MHLFTLPLYFDQLVLRLEDVVIRWQFFRAMWYRQPVAAKDRRGIAHSASSERI